MTNLKIIHKMLILSACFALGMGLFAWYAWDMMETVKVNGPQYRRIIQGKDLIADILPPPEYLVEAYLVAFQMSTETDGGKIDALLKKTEQLRSDYETRRAYWTKELEDGAMKDQLLVKAHAPAAAFLDLVDRDLVPAVRAGRQNDARTLVSGRLKDLYEAHRAEIDTLVTSVNARAAEDERATAALMRSRSLWLVVIAVVILVGVTTFSLVVGSQVARGVSLLVSAMEELRAGHVTAAREILGRVRSR